MSCGGALGRLGKLYVKATEVDTTEATWDAVAIEAMFDHADWKEVCAVDVERDGQKEKIDVSDRCSGDFKAYVPGQQEGSITFKAFKRKPIAAGSWLDILRDAYNNNTTVAVLMLDDKRDVVGADGIVANCNVFNLSESQPLNGPIEISFELAISGCTTYAPPVQNVTKAA